MREAGVQRTYAFATEVARHEWRYLDLDDQSHFVDDIDQMPPTVTPSSPSSTWKPRAPRANLVHIAVCRFDDKPEAIEVTSLNISQSGMLVRSPVVPAVGCELEFKFALENGFEILLGTGRVVRQALDPYGEPTIGIAFADIDPARRRILARVIELNSEATGAT